MKNLLYVMIGGAIGSALRYLVGLICSRIAWLNFPFGTLCVNLLGCLLLGALVGLGQKYTTLSSTTYLLLTVGICGAFTTFSTLCSDSIKLLDNGQWLTALLYLMLNLVGGFLLFYLGRKLV